MKTKNLLLGACATAFALSAVQAEAQSITSRLSHINWSAVYGWSGDLGTPNVDLMETDINTADSLGDFFSDAKSGGNFSASVLLEIGHEYTIGGTTSNFTSISSNMSAAATTSASGVGVATIGTEVPGHILQFEFDVTSDLDYTLTGGAEAWVLNPVYAGVTLEVLNGGFYNSVFHSAFDAVDPTDFSTSGTLTAGHYRITNFALVNAGGNDSKGSYANYNFTVDSVPEPTTMAALALGAAALIRRKRRN
ncbi:MAG: PEP-CTERM sorting domain-containing protein [Fimbriimonadaceae bacterium]